MSAHGRLQRQTANRCGPSTSGGPRLLYSVAVAQPRCERGTATIKQTVQGYSPRLLSLNAWELLEDNRIDVFVDANFERERISFKKGTANINFDSKIIAITAVT